MDADAKKTALRMIPYGIYVLTSESKDGKVAAATVNWVTQTAFQPPLVVVGVKADSGAHSIIKESKTFALTFSARTKRARHLLFSSRSNEKAIPSAENLSVREAWARLFWTRPRRLLSVRW